MKRKRAEGKKHCTKSNVMIMQQNYKTFHRAFAKDVRINLMNVGRHIKHLFH